MLLRTNLLYLFIYFFTVKQKMSKNMIPVALHDILLEFVFQTHFRIIWEKKKKDNLNSTQR